MSTGGIHHCVDNNWIVAFMPNGGHMHTGMASNMSHTM